MSRPRAIKSYKEPSSSDGSSCSSDDDSVAEKSAQKKLQQKKPHPAQKSAKQPAPSKRLTPSKTEAASSSSGESDSDDIIIAPKKKPAVSASRAAASRSSVKVPATKEVFNVDSDSCTSPQPSRIKAKSLPAKSKAVASDSDDDQIIKTAKVKVESRAKVVQDDSDDALLSIIRTCKNIESDGEAGPRCLSAAAQAKLLDGDENEARLHPALQPLSEDLAKRAAKSSLPLMAAPVQRLQHVLVQCDEDCADLAGDSGVIGRFKYSDGRMLLDLKGYMYEGSLVPCCSLAVVHMKPTEARVEAVLDDFMALKQIGNVYDKEVGHGNLGSDDDDCSEGFVPADGEELEADEGDGKKQKKESKSSKSPSSSSQVKRRTMKSTAGSKSKTKATPSKSKPLRTSAKPSKKAAQGKVVTPKSGPASKSIPRSAAKSCSKTKKTRSDSSSNGSDSDYIE